MATQISRDTPKEKAIDKDSMKTDNMQLSPNDSPPEPTTYTCPMHPEIHADKPGNCPKCGMKLVVEKAQSSKALPKTYTCPMHPEIHETKPGNCPKCGMKLVKEIPAANANMDDMGGMQMPARPPGGDDNTTMDNIMMAKKNLGPIKTISSKASPRTVVYHLYIRDTTVTFGKNQNVPSQ